MLNHFGIKGMRWGIRRTPEELGHKPSNKKDDLANYHEDYKKAHDSKSVKMMSDAELRNRLNRLNMEKQYAQLNPGTIERGRAKVGSVLKVLGTVAGTAGTIIALKNNYSTIASWFENA